MKINSIYTKIFLILLGSSILAMVFFAAIAHYDTKIILQVHVLEEEVMNLFSSEKTVNEEIFREDYTPQQNVDLTLEKLVKWYMLDLGVILLLLIVPYVFFARSITKPVFAITKAAKKISKGNLHVHVPEKRTDELGDLASAFNEAVRKLRDSKKEVEKKVSQLQKSKKENTRIIRKLDTALAQAHTADRMKTQFLSVTSHELRTPITPMKMQLQMLLSSSLGKISKKQKKSLEMILRNSERLDALIGDILDISKIESGNMKFDMEKQDINILLVHTVETMQIKAKQKNIRIINTVSNLPKIIFDKNRIEQVFVNLINNSIKFTDEQGTITIGCKTKRNLVVFSVRDTGIGMKKSDLERIFKPFEQVDSSRNRNYEGSGLGLAITKGIVQAHGGTIEAKSSPGKGSEFIITLPKNAKIMKQAEVITIEKKKKKKIRKK